MNKRSTSPPAVPKGRRFAAAIAAATVAGSLLSALLLAFDGRSPPRWLAPTPELMEQVAQCDSLLDRPTRERCTQQLVASRLAEDERRDRLARATDPTRLAER